VLLSSRRRVAVLVVALVVVLAVALSVLAGSPSGSPAGPTRPRHTAIPQSQVPDSTAGRVAMRVLSNGCRYTPRGIPLCSALLGAAYGANSDPTSWERSMGHPLGVHRTYWAARQVPAAVAQARRDIARGRLPWVSFKLPYSWNRMAAGGGDAWARSVARRLRSVPGPVWVAFHHEPEGDGSISEWTRMQRRLAPIVRRTAPNVGYTIVLTGWNQLYGPPRFRLGAVWPTGATIDVVGFDVYDKFGVDKDGQRFTTHTSFVRSYFLPFERFAQSHHTRWAIAETGETDSSAAQDPQWMRRTYLDLVRYHGVALSYFDSGLNSRADWRLTGAKERAFAEALRLTPTL
jgi:hypothetical protein